MKKDSQPVGSMPIRLGGKEVWKVNEMKGGNELLDQRLYKAIAKSYGKCGFRASRLTSIKDLTYSLTSRYQEGLGID